MTLPTSPSLEQLRKQAKERLREWRAEPATAERKLSDAQLAIAREHGFASWPKLRAYVERVNAHGPDLQHAYHEDLDYYEGRAFGLLASAQDATPGAAESFERWKAPLTMAGARTVIAREHGFPGWTALRRHVGGLRADGEPFARAFRAIEAHDLDALRALLDRFPELVRTRGTNGNDLIGMAGATCDERLVRILLDHGASPATANAHGWTPLHQAAYSDLPLLAQMLLDAGATTDVSARGDGGTPLVIGLFWGNRRVPELLAERSLAPHNLRVAAGLGLLDLIDELVGTEAAGAHRGYYRPHSGFPHWQPGEGPEEALDEALSWASRSGRTDAVELLVARGARIDADVYRGTALAWAASRGHNETVGKLLSLGADPNARTTFGGPDHGEAATALHLAAESGRIAVIEQLLAAGADPTIHDARHDHTPAGWAQFGGRMDVHDLLKAAESG